MASRTAKLALPPSVTSPQLRVLLNPPLSLLPLCPLLLSELSPQLRSSELSPLLDPLLLGLAPPARPPCSSHTCTHANQVRSAEEDPACTWCSSSACPLSALSCSVSSARNFAASCELSLLLDLLLLGLALLLGPLLLGLTPLLGPLLLGLALLLGLLLLGLTLLLCSLLLLRPLCMGAVESCSACVEEECYLQMGHACP